MMKLKNLTALVFVLLCSYGMAQDYPFSDQGNGGNWVLNGDLSDEFQGASLNKTRWHLQGESCVGTTGCQNSLYFNNFKGRWPAQFTPNNAWIAGGKLILETRWEPSFPFLNECAPAAQPQYCYGKDLDGNPLPITTAGVNTFKTFTYGYMEIKSKAADAEITSSFWTIGGGGEIDMFEMFGKYEGGVVRKEKEKELKFNMIEWNTGFEPRFDTFIKMDWRVADSFHVYGYEWDNTSITLYIDGVFIRKFTKADFNKGEGDEWFFTTPERLWVDQEVFYWNGLPNQADLPAQFQIEYIRVWQKAGQIEDITVPILSDLNTTASASGMVSVVVSEQARLYLVPSGTPRNLVSIQAADPNPDIFYEGTASIENSGASGNYILYAVDWAGNISLATSSFTMATLGIESNSLLKFSVSPNPSNSHVKIVSSEPIQTDSVLFFNLIGQSFKLPQLNNNTFDVSRLSSGMYFIKMSNYSPVRFLKN